MQLTRLAYASNHGGIADDALDDILRRSRTNNDKDGITGVLVVSDEEFVQLLEGPRTAVSRCFMRIMQDVRHHHIRVLLAGAIESRLCAEGGMRCIATSQSDQGPLSRYWINGTFEPDEMSEAAILGLCRDISEST
ncbi:MAG: BLUF domain-containing protein [Paracoccus sp. (in: a-proteobacteria)]|uniref:BLUF domain-containing protein n=1 Tax=Paracoccus sp. TaxID=267 RepID=UPI00391AD477